MLNFNSFSKFFSKNEDRSKNIAKNRLKLILIHDKTGMNSDVLKKIKEEITEILLKYTNVSKEELDIKITTSESEGNKGVPIINANIPLDIIENAGA